MRDVDDFLVTIATTYVNPADFRADGATTRRISFPAAQIDSRMLDASHRTVLTCLPSPVVSLPGTSCIAMYVCTNTPTRAGHAPKRSLITSILLPLTAHYRASRIVSFNLPRTAGSRNAHREGSPSTSPPLKIPPLPRVNFPFALGAIAIRKSATNGRALLVQ